MTRGEAAVAEIRFRAWDERADDLIEQLLRTLQTLQVGKPSDIKRIHNARVGVSPHGTASDTLDSLDISVHPELPSKNIPEIFVSYAWGDDSSKMPGSAVKSSLCDPDKDGILSVTVKDCGQVN